MKTYPCFCHKCGTRFKSENAIAITCTSCTLGRTTTLGPDFWEQFTNGFGTKKPAK